MGACGAVDGDQSAETPAAPHADLTELTLPSNIKISFPEGKEKPMHFEITIRPDEGMYRWVGPRPAAHGCRETRACVRCVCAAQRVCMCMFARRAPHPHPGAAAWLPARLPAGAASSCLTLSSPRGTHTTRPRSSARPRCVSGGGGARQTARARGQLCGGEPAARAASRQLGLLAAARGQAASLLQAAAGVQSHSMRRPASLRLEGARFWGGSNRVAAPLASQRSSGAAALRWRGQRGSCA